MLKGEDGVWMLKGLANSSKGFESSPRITTDWRCYHLCPDIAGDEDVHFPAVHPQPLRQLFGHLQEQELFAGLPQPEIWLSHLLLELLKYLLFSLTV